MTNQEKELNEKLARWAGNINHSWTDEVCGYKTTECFCENCNRAEDYTPFPCVPGFTDSLDACFKWLVPKLAKMPNLHVIDYQYVGFCQNTKLLRHGWLIILADDEGDYSANDNDPALAFCLAVEKLIEVME